MTGPSLGNETHTINLFYRKSRRKNTRHNDGVVRDVESQALHLVRRESRANHPQNQNLYNNGGRNKAMGVVIRHVEQEK